MSEMMDFSPSLTMQVHKKYLAGESLSDFELEVLIVLYREMATLLEIASPPFDISRDCAFRTLEELNRMSEDRHGGKSATNAAGSLNGAR